MPKTNNRDDFLAPVIRELRERSGNACSKCGVSTLAPKSGPRGVLVHGVAAHIYAASPAGPRPAPHLSREERRAYDNGIWLCHDCASLVDKDSVHYPAAALVALKMKREAEARETLGRRPGEKEGHQQVLAAMSGFPSLGATPPVIANAHRATELFMHRLDPRLEIRSSYSNGRAQIEIEARAPVSFTLVAPLAHQRGWQAAIDELLAHGIGNFSLQGVKAEGSPLLAQIVDQAVSMSIETAPRAATLRLDLESPDREVWPFMHTEGGVIAGSASAVYEGRAFDGLFSICMPIDLAPSGSREGLTFKIDFERWSGRRLVEIPFTAKINEFVDKLKTQWRPRLTMEVEGEKVFTTLGIANAETIFNLEFYRYLHACVRLAGFARSNARFQPTAEISRLEFDEVIEARDHHDPAVVLTGRDFRRPIMLKGPTDAQATALFSAEHLVVRAQEHEPQTVRLFGQATTLPRREWLCGKARLVQRDDIAADPGFRACELIMDDDAPVTMSPTRPGPTS